MRTRETDRAWQELEREVLRRGLPDRVMMALMDAVFGYKVRKYDIDPRQYR